MYSLEEIKKATDIYVYLIDKGELKLDDDKELFNSYGEQNIKVILDGMAQQSNIYIRLLGDSIYLIPNVDNEFLGYKRGELKTAILGRRSDIRLEDYYLSIYIIIVVLCEFYGGKGVDPRLRTSIELNDIEVIIHQKLVPLTEKDVSKIEGETKLAISVIANLWVNTINDDDYNKVKSRKWYIKQVCEFLKKEGLVNILDETNVVPAKKLDRLVLNHLLNADRLAEINKALNMAVMEDDI